MSADDLRLVSQRQACKLLGISRDRFVRWTLTEAGWRVA